MTKDPFEEYIRHIEADKKEKSYAWQTAIGLQEVDGLKPSQYLISTAIKNIEGEISIDTAEQWISQYYEENPPILTYRVTHSEVALQPSVRRRAMCNLVSKLGTKARAGRSHQR